MLKKENATQVTKESSHQEFSQKLLQKIVETSSIVNLHKCLHKKTESCAYGTSGIMGEAQAGSICPALLETANKALQYLHMVLRANEKFNLISKQASNEIINHLGDVWCSVNVFAKFFAAHGSNGHKSGSKLSVIDVGSGAGFPVVLLAMVFKTVNFTAVESNNKKAIFLKNCAKQLSLLNLNVHAGNVYEFYPPEKANFVVSRAFASVQKTLKSCHKLLNSNGKYVLFKGKQETIKAELAEARGQLKNKSVSKILLQHPFLSHQRHLLCIAQVGKVKLNS